MVTFANTTRKINVYQRFNIACTELVGAKWKLQGSSPQGCDCYGVPKYILRAMYDIELPSMQYTEQDWDPICDDAVNKLFNDYFTPTDVVYIGDVLFFKLSKDQKYVNHMAVAMSNGSVIHALRRHGVVIAHFSRFSKYFAFAGNPLKWVKEPSH